VLATDWTAVASIATAAGTLVLAIATFASVRSANRAARIAEHAFQVGLRPVLFPSRLDDVTQKIRWGDDHMARLDGGRAIFQEVDGAIYLAMSVRNAGHGFAVIHSWSAKGRDSTEDHNELPDIATFIPQQRDLYVPADDVSFWQAAYRPGDGRDARDVRNVLAAEGNLMIDLLYSDHEGAQRTVTRFLVSPYGEPPEERRYLCSVTRHWSLDRPDPRS
jgi:hypothetical protein